MRDKSTDFVIQTRLDPRDYARLLIYYQERGIVFQSRAEMIRYTIESYIKEQKLPEITTAEASILILDHSFVKTERQAVIASLGLKSLEERAQQVKNIGKIQMQTEEDILNKLEEE